ncbi:hypothetical protein, partial [Altererythrobacter sp.]|uniref:hypothetical protein n=1 Tax=Altererythrobacter sp. TaxID=1872480 RepID=UPI003D141425
MATDSVATQERNDVLAAVHELLAGLPGRPELDACRAEGQAIAAILEPFGLPAEILAAVHAYPAFREGFFDTKAIENRSLEELPRLLLGLRQL